MPEKTKQRRLQIARRQGKSVARKSSEVGKAAGLSTHAAKKSSHVEGMLKPRRRNVSRKAPPGAGKWGGLETGRAAEIPEVPQQGRSGRKRAPIASSARLSQPLERERALKRKVSPKRGADRPLG